MPKYKKNLTNPYLYQLYQSPKDRAKLLNTRIIDEIDSSSMTISTDGAFKAVCLGGMRTEDNTGAGTDENDGRFNGKHIFIIVRPVQEAQAEAMGIPFFGDILPDPRVFNTSPVEINKCITLHKNIFEARSDFEYNSESPISFGQIIDCYFENGSIKNSDFSGLRFSQPNGEPDFGDRSFQNLGSVAGVITATDAFQNGNASMLGNQGGTTESTNPAQQAFERKIGAAIRAKGLEFHVTDRSRTVEDQMNRIMNKYKGNGKEEVLSTYGRTGRGARMVAAIERGDMAALRKEASNSSRHLKGAAIDIRSRWYDDAQMVIVLAEIRKLGGNPLVEPISGNCWEKSGRGVVNAKRNGAPGGGKGAACYNEHIHIDIPKDFK